MVVPFTRMWFIVDAYSDSVLSGDRVFAEYDLLRRAVVWKRWSDAQDDRNMSLVGRVLSLAPLSSPLIVVPVIGLLGGYTLDVATPEARLGGWCLVLPVVVGLLVLAGFEFFMLHVREGAEVVPAPPVGEQLAYFRSLFEHQIRRNTAVGDYRTPYIVNVVLFVFLAVLVIPLMFWLYMQKDTAATFSAKLLMLGVLLAAVLELVWAGVAKGIVMQKLIRSLDEREAKDA